MSARTSPPAQQQTAPGATEEMVPAPRDEMAEYRGRGLLDGKRALVTGGDSGIGRAVSVAFAKEGADVAIAYHAELEDADAEHTAELVRAQQRQCELHRTDLGDEAACQRLVDEAAAELSGLDVLVNHAGTQAPVERFTDTTTEQFDRTFKVNVYAPFWLTRAALTHMSEGSAIINTGSVNGLRGNKTLIDYAASKGAVHVLTMSLAQSLAQRGIRVNCVAPGPVWTPLIPATLPEESVEGFGDHVPMGRMGQPDEIAPSYVFFAADQLSSYYTGKVLAPVGGETHPG
ncbi:SDR family oxidoreductase [Saccharopolyspora sp. NPDC047091]|uniref:SDR family oxidoreductase n=1 Tax=Saccharopolyspora sp. NPDC047091 TaxID=3155924 RepID=UPI0033CE0486